MNISAETQNLMQELNEYSGSKLKNITDLSILNDIALSSGNDKLYYDLQFSAKYVNGLSKILQDNISASPGREGFNQPSGASAQEGISPESLEEARAKISNEFKSNIMKFTELLKDLLKSADEELKVDFESKYLSLTREAMLNLNTLIYDLSWLKKYNNSQRI